MKKDHKTRNVKDSCTFADHKHTDSREVGERVMAKGGAKGDGKSYQLDRLSIESVGTFLGRRTSFTGDAVDGWEGELACLIYDYYHFAE